MALFDPIRRFFRTLFSAPGNIQDLADMLHDRYVPRSFHEARVRELHAYANEQVDLRRAMQGSVVESDLLVQKATELVHVNRGLGKAYDYAGANKHLTDIFTLLVIEAFTRGYVGLPFTMPDKPELRAAYTAGFAASVPVTELTAKAG